MSTLKYLKRKNKIALIFLFVGALLPQAPYVPTGNLCGQVGCNYILSGFLIIILLMYACLLNYRNHIETLENSPNLKNDNKIYKENKPEISEEDKINIGKKYLKTLTKDEKEILKYFFDNNTKTQRLRSWSGIVKGLEIKDIIFRSSEYGTKLKEFDFNITDWAWEYLNKNTHLLR